MNICWHADWTDLMVFSTPSTEDYVFLNIMEIIDFNYNREDQNGYSDIWSECLGSLYLLIHFFVIWWDITLSVAFSETRGPVGYSLDVCFSKTSQAGQLFLESYRKGIFNLLFDKRRYV